MDTGVLRLRIKIHLEQTGVSPRLLVGTGITGFSWTNVNGGTREFNTTLTTYHMYTAFGCTTPWADDPKSALLIQEHLHL